MKITALSALLGTTAALNTSRIHGGPAITPDLEPDHCFNLLSGHKHRLASSDWVLGTETGASGDEVLTLVHFDEHSRNQEWYWNKDDQSLKNGSFPNKRVDARHGGVNGDIVLNTPGDTNQFQHGYVFSTGNGMMLTSDFEAFHVDHDTNHIKHRP